MFNLFYKIFNSYSNNMKMFKYERMNNKSSIKGEKTTIKYS